MRVQFILTLVFVLLFKALLAQFQIKVQIHCRGDICDEMKIYSDTLVFPSVTEANLFLTQILETANTSGYAAACYDSLTYSDTLITAVFLEGPRISLSGIYYKNISADTLKKAGIHPEKQKNPFFSTSEIKNILKKIVVFYENNGFPFVKVGIDSLHYRNDTIWTVVQCERGPRVIVDTIINLGNLEINPQVLYSLINVFPGQPYNESAVQAISSRIRSHRFITEKTSVSVSFEDRRAIIYLNLDKKPVNTFDGIVGFMPDHLEEGKLFLTGELMLSVTNALSLSENIHLKWRQPSRGSQDLKAGISLPWLIYVPLGFSWDFLLLKKDTTYLNVENRFTLYYSGNMYSKTGAYLHYLTSNLISAGQYQQNTVLPQVSDLNVISLGLLSQYRRLDNINNPAKGFSFHFDISAGKKTIVKNPGIEDSLYDNLKLNDFRFQFESDISFYIPLIKQHSMHLRNFSGIKRSDHLFLNELYTIGGLRNLRGFDENRFYASSFSLQTVEYGYLFDENSRFIVFMDFAYIEKKTITDYHIQRPFGFGTGLTFDTSQGIFSLVYALGKTQDQHLNFKSSKIHFGYLLVF